MLLDIGIMVGSSADGVDIVGSHIDKDNIEVIFHYQKQLTDTLQKSLKAAVDNLKTINSQEIAELEAQLTDAVIESFEEINIEDSHKIRQVSYHGYTLCHYPQFGLSWQLGDVKKIADKLDCLVIHDFRQNIIENGGVGAPLIPNFHHWLSRSQNIESVNYINIGGISNISVVDGHETWGTDIGPGNCLSDLISRFYFNKSYDSDGQLSLQGHYDEELYNLIDVFYAQRLPSVKEMNREKVFCLTRQDFQLDELMCKLARTQKAPCDVLMTSHHFVASRICEVVGCTHIENLEFFGGGVLNQTLMQVIKHKLDSCQVGAQLWHPQIMESLAFAWLGNQRIQNKKHHRSIIGTSKDLMLGEIVYPDAQESHHHQGKIALFKKVFY